MFDRLYTQIDNEYRCISVCSERQNESDIEIESYPDNFLEELDYYIFRNGKLIFDNEYVRPNIVIEPTDKERITMLENTILFLLGGDL